MAREVVIRGSRGTVSGRWRAIRRPEGPAILLAHGAGTNQDHRSIVALRDGLAAHRLPVLTFNYPYTERGSGRPDRQETLLDTHRAAAAWLRSRHDGIVMAGRSMGGRMATYLAADGESCRGLVLYAYPLHPAGKPDRLRVDHLGDIPVPSLFFTGTRDALAQPDLVERHLRPLPRARLELIEDADHSFRVPKRSGRTSDEVLTWIVDRTAQWVKALP